MHDEPVHTPGEIPAPDVPPAAPPVASPVTQPAPVAPPVTQPAPAGPSKAGHAGVVAIAVVFSLFAGAAAGLVGGYAAYRFAPDLSLIHI